MTEETGFGGIIGTSPQMVKVFNLIKKVAGSDATILIRGDSGTGKELVAKTVHRHSPRADRPFVPVNCGAIPKDLIESELFGHEKGSFTGAIASRPGRFELANSGTIFLDEIGELHPSLQVKLLRVVQEREFERVGGVKTIKADIRILAATNVDLEKAIKEGTFREDLYYRLSVIPIIIPPLRERTNDVRLLLDYFMTQFCEKRGRERLGISVEAMESFLSYPWPGNVRELENMIERLTILTDGDTICLDDLPERLQAGVSMNQTLQAAASQDSGLPEDGINLNAYLSDLEKRLIEQAMQRSGGVKSKAASLLGLNRTTLIEKLKKNT